MTPEQQRIAIAEACGYWFYKESTDINTRVYRGKPGDSHHEFIGLIGHACNNPLPNYLSDLNAMHEAEKVLPIDRQYEYGEKLRVISGNVGPKGGHFTPNGFGCYALAHLSATQRAEAFLRTLNLWTT